MRTIIIETAENLLLFFFFLPLRFVPHSDAPPTKRSVAAAVDGGDGDGWTKATDAAARDVGRC